MILLSAVCLDLLQQMLSCWKRNDFKEGTCQDEYIKYAACVDEHLVSTMCSHSHSPVPDTMESLHTKQFWRPDKMMSVMNCLAYWV